MKRRCDQCGATPHHALGLCGRCYASRHRFDTDGYQSRELFDDVVVERLVAGGYRGRASFAELHAAIDRLESWEMSAKDIAERVGCTQRTVTRHRQSKQRKAVA